MFDVKIENQVVLARLTHLKAIGRNMSRVMGKIARLLHNVTEDAFAHERSPFGVVWKAIHREGKILQDSGLLAASIAHSSGSDFAQLSAGKIYAAIHQFSGMAGRGKKTKIDARPYMPIDKDGNLAPKTESMILDLIEKDLNS